MVEPAHARQTYNFTVTCFPSLDRPLVRRVFPQSIVNPILMIVNQGTHEPIFSSGFR